MTPAHPFLAFDHIDDIGLLTLNLPPQNFVPQPDFIDLDELKKWIVVNNFKGLIIQGAGRHFSAGADLKKLFQFALDEKQLIGKMAKGKALLDFIYNLNIPVIGAIKGSCFGAGLEIALACHIRVCTSNSLFAFPEINHNLMPGLAGTLRLSEVAGFSNAMKMMLTGDIFNAEKALEMKLVDYVTDEKDIKDFALKMMKRMTDHRPREVIHSIMTSLHNYRKLSFAEALREETRLFCKLAAAEARKLSTSE